MFSYSSYSVKFCCLLLPTILLLGIPAWGEEANDTFPSSVFDAGTEEIHTTSRIPRLSSKIAENVTVINTDDIARLNAHTLADILQTIPGIQLDYLRTPGNWSYFSLQGAINSTVLVLVDGVRQNDFDQNAVSPGLISVQQIERIEIVKGAASTIWGSALGGVVNIVTKEPNPDAKASGMVSGSTGTRFTADSRGEVSGTIDSFGYYLSAGNLHSDGLSPNNGGNANNFFTKLVYSLPGNGKTTFGFSYLDSEMGQDEGGLPLGDGTLLPVHDNEKNRRTNTYLKLSQPLANRLTLDVDAYVTSLDDHILYGDTYNRPLTITNDFNHRESSRGVSLRITWGDSRRNLTAGTEYGHAQARNTDLLSTDGPVYDRSWDSWALYGNGTYSLGRLTLLGGVRLDLTGIAGNNLSGTVGATYNLGETTTLRAYWAPQGYSLPNLYQRVGTLQKIETVQAGIETGIIANLWLKGTWFYNTLRNSSEAGVQLTNQERQGFEIEARTSPLYGLFLTGGYTFLYARNSDTGERLQTNSDHSVPPHIAKLALNYDNTPLGLRGTLTGNYVWWNGSPDYLDANQGVVWDLHLTWKLRAASELSPEIFFSGHNLLNANLTTYTPLFSTPTRWFDGGMRYKF